ncbi:MAG: hypothetical protein WD336_02155 [Trueperaceae bacterium]
MLRSQPPRHLGGFRPFFETHELTVNDAVELRLAGDAIRIAPVRRPRRSERPEHVPYRSTWSAFVAAESSGGTRASAGHAPPSGGHGELHGTSIGSSAGSDASVPEERRADAPDDLDREHAPEEHPLGAQVMERIGSVTVRRLGRGAVTRPPESSLTRSPERSDAQAPAPAASPMPAREVRESEARVRDPRPPEATPLEAVPTEAAPRDAGPTPDAHEEPPEEAPTASDRPSAETFASEAFPAAHDGAPPATPVAAPSDDVVVTENDLADPESSRPRMVLGPPRPARERERGRQEHVSRAGDLRNRIVRWMLDPDTPVIVPFERVEQEFGLEANVVRDVLHGILEEPPPSLRLTTLRDGIVRVSRVTVEIED